MNERLTAVVFAAAAGFLTGFILARVTGVKRKHRIILACVLLAAEYASLFLVYGVNLSVIPVLGLAAGTAGAALRQSEGKSAREFAAFAIVWWIVTILLKGDTWSAWGRSLASGAIGGAILLAVAFLLRLITDRYGKQKGAESGLFTRTDCVLLSLPGFYFGVAVGVFGLLIELLAALIPANVRVKERVPSGAAAAAACWACALIGERFMSWYVGFF